MVHDGHFRSELSRLGVGWSECRYGASGYCVSNEDFAIAPARDDLVEELAQYLREEIDTAFRRYLGVGPFIDDTYTTAMAPFLRSLPS